MNRLLLRDPFFRVDPWRLLDQTLEAWGGAPRRAEGGALPLNVYANEDRVVVTGLIPGVDPASVDLFVQGETLRIRAERKGDDGSEGGAVHRSERRAGAIDRTISLPYAIESEQVTAEVKHGVLTVHLPRLESTKPRRVQVTG